MTVQSTENPTDPDAMLTERQAAREAGQLRAIDLSEFLEMELPARENVLAPWLPSQGLAMIHAPRGVGKTFLAISIAYAVASGGTFLKWTAPTPRGVLFIDGEMPQVVMQDRFAAVATSVDYEQQVPLRIITPDQQNYAMPDLATPEGQEAVNAHITDDISLLIADNLSSLIRSGKENEAESWEPVQTWALGLRKLGKSVLLIHHSGKAGQQRGTSRREDVLDTVIALKRPAGYNPQDGAVFEVHCEKARGIYGQDTTPFEAKLTTDHNGHQVWTTRTLEDTKRQRVFELLDAGMSQADMARELGVNRSTISRLVKKRRNP